MAIIDACGITTVAEAIDLYDKYYGEAELKPRALAQLHARLSATP